MSYDLMVAASPTSPFVFMVTQETEEFDAQEVYRESGLFDDMLDIITQLREKYPIATISVYGPHIYIGHLKKIIEERFEHYNVILCPAGA